jgi:hypothetical protein
MKQRLQGMVMGVVATILLLGTITVFAAPGVITKSIEVTFANYKTSLFGQEYTVQDKDENVLMPFAYAGSVYFPMESILRALGSNAQWNENTGMLNYGAVADASTATTTTGKNFALTVPPYDVSHTDMSDKDSIDVRVRYTATSSMFQSEYYDVRKRNSVIMGGTVYENVITYRSGGYPINKKQSFHSLHNLEGKYAMLTGYLGRGDGSNEVNVTFNFYGDGKVIKTYYLKATDLPTLVSLDVKNVKQLKIEMVPDTSVYKHFYAFAGTIQ